MYGFSYFTPTKVVFGRNTESRAAELIREFGGKKVLIHYGGGSVIRSGLLKRVTDTLTEAGIPLAGKSVCLLGAGGAARSIGVECALAGAAFITVINRSRERGEALAEVIRESSGEISA